MKFITIVAILLLPASALGAERVIRLVDGSRILGDVVSMHNDSFIVKTQTLGTVNIKASQIAGMTRPGEPPARHNPSATTGAGQAPAASRTVQSIRSGIAGNAELMRDILRLQSDPRMKAVLADPRLMKAVRNLDFDKLAKDPRIQALMNDPAVKKIQSGIQQ